MTTRITTGLAAVSLMFAFAGLASAAQLLTSYVLIGPDQTVVCIITNASNDSVGFSVEALDGLGNVIGGGVGTLSPFSSSHNALEPGRAAACRFEVKSKNRVRANATVIWEGRVFTIVPAQ
jgi:hypothetical protein